MPAPPAQHASLPAPPLTAPPPSHPRQPCTTTHHRLEALPAPRYVLFTADDDPTTGTSWCPDCVRAVPAVRRTLAECGASLLEVGVGQRGDWKGNAAHPCRRAARAGAGGRQVAGRGLDGVGRRGLCRPVRGGNLRVALHTPQGLPRALSSAAPPPPPRPLRCWHRTDARFRVGGVPTLAHWPGGGGAATKMGPELEAAGSPAEAVALVAKFVADTSK